MWAIVLSNEYNLGILDYQETLQFNRNLFLTRICNLIGISSIEKKTPVIFAVCIS